MVFEDDIKSPLHLLNVAIFIFITISLNYFVPMPLFAEMVRSWLPSVTMAPYGAGTGSDLWQRTISFCIFVSPLFVRELSSVLVNLYFWTYAFSYEYLYCSSSLTLFYSMENCKFFKYIFWITFLDVKIDMLQTKYNFRGQNGGEADEAKTQDESTWQENQT